MKELVIRERVSDSDDWIPDLQHQKLVAQEEVESEELLVEEDDVVEESKQVDYIFFTVNIHDWVYPENSAESLNKLVDLHNEYELYVDFYLADPIFQIYLDDYPELIEKIKESDYVAISHHLRPPAPHADFDTIGLADMLYDEQYDIVYAYETHALDLVTGGYTDDLGGYQLMKDTFGYAPIAYAGNKVAVEASTQVFYDLGARMAVAKNQEQEDAATALGIEFRPETDEFRMWNYFEEGYGDALSDFEDLRTNRVDYLHIKVHDNNFYMGNAGFWNVYKNPGAGPFVLGKAFQSSLYDETYNEFAWLQYEAMLQHVKNDGSLESLNLAMYADME